MTAVQTLKATSIEQSIALDRGRIYRLTHNCEDGAGGQTTETIYLATGSTTPDETEGDDKGMLVAGGPLVLIGRGVSQLNYKTASGGNALFTLAVDASWLV
jgi:hypothetical protein